MGGESRERRIWGGERRVMQNEGLKEGHGVGGRREGGEGGRGRKGDMRPCVA